MTLRFDLNPPCEPAHILLTALARVARWTGVYAWGIDARAHGDDLTDPDRHAASRRDLVVRPSVTPKFQIFFRQAPAHALARIKRAQLSSVHTYVCVSIAQSHKCTTTPPTLKFPPAAPVTAM